MQRLGIVIGAETDGKPMRSQPFVPDASHLNGITSGIKGYHGLTGRQEKVKNEVEAEVYTLEEKANSLKISKQTLLKLVVKGDVKGYKVGTQWRFDKKAPDSDVDSEAQRKMDGAKQMQIANQKEAERLAIMKGEMERAEAKLIRFCNEQGKELKDWLESDKEFEG